MPSPEEKRHRKELQQQARRQERTRLETGSPLSRDQLSGLFDHLDSALVEGGDHTLRLTRAYLRTYGLEEERIVPWLVELGGGCDCEVLANVEEHFPAGCRPNIAQHPTAMRSLTLRLKADRAAGGLGIRECARMEHTRPAMFDQLLGEQLSAVTFLQGYLQLWFDGPGINVDNPLTVHSGERSITSWQPGFRDALCAQIAKLVASVEILDGEAFVIGFQDGSRLSISLREQDYTSPEAIYAHGFRDHPHIVF